MKKILRQMVAVMVFSVLLCTLLPTTVQAGGSYLGPGENLSWSIENGTLTISGVGAMNDFTGAYPEWYGLSIVKVVIENGVTSIGSNAFEKEFYIKSVSIPDSVTSIGDSAFGDCQSLKNINIPRSVTSIGDNAFFGCKSLENFVIPNGVKVIGQRTFQACESLKTVTIPNTVTEIKDCAFAECETLKKVHIPGSVINIGNSAFYKCVALTDLKLSEGLKIIDDSAFFWGWKASSITIPSTVTKIGKSAFFYSKANKIYFLGQKPSIANNAFTGMRAIAYYPASWRKAPSTGYGGDLIWKQSSTTLKKGEVVTDKKTNGVYKITGKNTVIYQRPATKKSTVTIPSKVKINNVIYKVTEIAKNSFAYDSVLRKVTIPSTIKKIGKKTFYNCKHLKTIVIKTTSLKKNTIGSQAFKGIYAQATIKVPKSKLKLYRSILKARGVSSKAKIKK